jgi:hypothetical protein
MKRPMMLLGLCAITAAQAVAQDAIPDLKGTWSGQGKSLVYGSNPHHPDGEAAVGPPRVRDIEVTHTVEGQEVRLAWGTSSSATADTREPFAWVISADNRTVVGSDTDGSFHITIVAPDRIEKCYTHTGSGPTGSIVATCYMMDRLR